MGNTKPGNTSKIISLPGPGSAPGRMTPEQGEELRRKMQAAAVEYMEEMTTPGLARRIMIEKCANAVTLVINILSIGSDAVSVCCAARVIRDRMDLIRATVLPAITAEVPNFAAQEQGIVDLLLGDTGVIFEIYSSVLDDDQMKAFLYQFKRDAEDGE